MFTSLFSKCLHCAGYGVSIFHHLGSKLGSEKLRSRGRSFMLRYDGTVSRSLFVGKLIRVTKGLSKVLRSVLFLLPMIKLIAFLI